MPAEVKNDGMVDGLAGQACARATRQDGDALPVGQLDDGYYVVGITRSDDADGLHLVDAGVGAVEGAGEIVESDFAGDASFELGGEVSGEGGIGVGGEGHGIGFSEGLTIIRGSGPLIESLTQARLLIVSRNFARHLMDFQCFFSIGKDRVGRWGDARG